MKELIIKGLGLLLLFGGIYFGYISYQKDKRLLEGYSYVRDMSAAFWLLMLGILLLLL